METMYLAIVFLATFVAIVTAVHHYVKNDRLTSDLEDLKLALKSAQRATLDKKEEIFRLNAKLTAGLELGRSLRKERDLLIIELESANIKLAAIVALNTAIKENVDAAVKEAISTDESIEAPVEEQTQEEVLTVPTPPTPPTVAVPTVNVTSKKSNRRKR